MPSKNDLVGDLAPWVRKVAKKVAGNWPTVICSDDLEQELYLRLLEFSEGALGRLVEATDGARYGSLNRMAVQIASGYRNDYEMFTGNYHYGADEVRQLLEDGSLVFPDLLTASERSDLALAFDDLSDHYQEVLTRRFVEFDNDRSDRMTISRAVNSLTLHMNRVRKFTEDTHDGPARRREAPCSSDG